MYALNVGVRNEFFSLSCFSKTPEEAIEKSQEVIEAWCGSYALDPSWDENMNGQGNMSLVWCRDGSKVLRPKHFENGFFMILVKESKDSEIKLWDPVVGSTRILLVDIAKFGGPSGLRLVKPFRGLDPVERSIRKNPLLVPFSNDHLNQWASELVDNDGGFSSGLFAWPETHLLPRRLNVVSAN